MTAGRPTVMTELVVSKLEGAFSIGATDVEACAVAGISKQTLYDYQKIHPEFVDRKEALKSMTSLAAKNVIDEKIKEGDVDTAKWQLERRNKDEYATKSTQEVTGKDGGAIETRSLTMSDEEIIKRYLEANKKD